MTFLLWTVVNSFSQTQTVTPIKDYAKKSKNQKKAARILLCGGAALVATGVIIPQGEFKSYSILLYPEHKNDAIKGTFILAGALSALGSIPLFIASKRNKRKANKATISFKNEKVLFFHKNDFFLESQPSLNLKIGL